MKMPVLLGAVVASLILGALNNLVSKNSVSWVGSPEVLPKPTGWPSLSAAQGVKGAWEVVEKGAVAHRLPILAGLAVLAVAAFLLRRFRGASFPDLLRTALRLGLAAMFYYAAKVKFADPAEFARMVAQYQFLPGPLVNAFSVVMPALEIVVAVGLVFTAWEREFSALVGVLLLMFIVALGQALARDLGIACGCFDITGAGSPGETWFALLRDIVLLVPVAWMVRCGSRRWLWQFGPAPAA